MTGNILDNTTELYKIKYTFGEIFSSGGATLCKNPSDQSVNMITFFSSLSPQKSVFLFGYLVSKRLGDIKKISWLSGWTLCRLRSGQVIAFFKGLGSLPYSKSFRDL